jgi:hypothetical protein
MILQAFLPLILMPTFDKTADPKYHDCGLPWVVSYLGLPWLHAHQWTRLTISNIFQYLCPEIRKWNDRDSVKHWITGKRTTTDHWYIFVVCSLFICASQTFWDTEVHFLINNYLPETEWTTLFHVKNYENFPMHAPQKNFLEYTEINLFLHLTSSFNL